MFFYNQIVLIHVKISLEIFSSYIELAKILNYKNLNTLFLSFGILFLVLGSTSIVAFHLLSPSDIGVEEKSIEIKSVELYDVSIGWSPLSYKVDIVFDFISNEDFDITYGCSSPF